jgi:hypothetical protein
MERQPIDATTVPDPATIQPPAAHEPPPGAETWDVRAEAVLRTVWDFCNRHVIALHAAGRLAEAAEVSELREQVHAVLRERPQPPSTPTLAAELNHPLTQLAEGSGLPERDDPASYMPSLP